MNTMDHGVGASTMIVPMNVGRMRSRSGLTNPVEGTVVWAPVKSCWITFHVVIAALFAIPFYSPGAVASTLLLTVVTICCGHSVGLHRMLIHRSFVAPKAVRMLFVHLGTAVGMGGPLDMIYLHDIRDWAQRHARCHAFFIHQSSLLRDWWWQLHCTILLAHPPQMVVESEVVNSAGGRWMQRTWMLQQLPWAVLFWTMGGWGWVVWGISVRIVVSLTGHWLIGYLAHNGGVRDWHLHGHAVQGYNIPHLALISMGEAWHNNHHAFPGSARLGIARGQWDPGWWFILALQWLGLAWAIKTPESQDTRPELEALNRGGVVASVKPEVRRKRRLSLWFDVSE